MAANTVAGTTWAEASVPAFAKLNLSLKVRHRRPDGFHEIATLFQTISLADEIHIRAAAGDGIELECDVAIPGENLAVRAAQAVLRELDRKAQVHLRLRKVIPMGGGLGGGSADAAAILLALPKVLGEALEPQRLAVLAAELGSDVPFFLVGGLAAAGGRGEILEALPDLPEIHGVLVAPGIHVSTPDAYRALRRPGAEELTQSQRDAILVKFRALVRSVSEREPLPAWSGHCENDFEAAVFEAHPAIAKWREEIEKAGALLARMSGSGSTVFGLFADAASAQAAAAKLRVESGHVTVFHTIDRRRYERAWQQALAS